MQNTLLNEGIYDGLNEAISDIVGQGWVYYPVVDPINPCCAYGTLLLYCPFTDAVLYEAECVICCRNVPDIEVYSHIVREVIARVKALG